MAKIRHTKNVSYVKGNVTVEVDFERFDKNLSKAQYWLDSQIMTDMVPLMPHRDGEFIQRTRASSAALAGTGQVIAAERPFGRFLYMGKVMVDPETGSPWAQKDAEKVVTDRPLTFSNPVAVPMWFDAAKRLHKKEWIKGAENEFGSE